MQFRFKRDFELRLGRFRFVALEKKNKTNLNM